MRRLRVLYAPAAVPQEVRDVYRMLPASHAAEEADAWVASDWLELWANEDDVPAIKNEGLTCVHGKLDPAKVTSAKRISHAAWEKLHVSACTVAVHGCVHAHDMQALQREPCTR